MSGKEPGDHSKVERGVIVKRRWTWYCTERANLAARVRLTGQSRCDRVGSLIHSLS